MQVTTEAHEAGHDAQRGSAGQTRQQRREHLRHEVHHFAHMLSEQGPMNITFVHNNTLLGLQPLHFNDAIAEAKRVLGASGYEPVSNFRGYHARGRIVDKDLDRSIDESAMPGLDDVVARTATSAITRRQVLRAALLRDLGPASVADLRFAVEERGGLARLADDLPDALRGQVLARARASLKAAGDRVGDAALFSEWVGSLLGLDLMPALRSGALDKLGDMADGGAAWPETEESLARMGIAAEHRLRYLARIDALFVDEIAADESQRAALRRAAAAEEDALLGDLCRRHWGCEARLDGLREHLARHIETHASQSLWNASLSLLDLDDPFSITHPVSLQLTNGLLDAGETVASLLHAGALPTRVGRGLRTRIGALLDAATQAADAATPGRIDVVREQLEGGYLDAGGLQALDELCAALPAGASVMAELAGLAPAQRRRDYIDQLLAADLAAFGHGQTHAGWLARLTGDNLVERVNHYMIRQCAAFIDEGLAAWRMPDRSLGFFGAWRVSAPHDAGLDMDGLDGWREQIEQLPMDAEDAVMLLLERLGVPEPAWGEYLARMLAQLKGWAGMVYWYETHPRHYKQSVHKIDTLQYLAVRLFYESLLVRQSCRQHWNLDGHLEGLRRYFENQAAEFLIRRELHDGRLSESLSETARRALEVRGRGREQQLAALADAVWMYRIDHEGVERAASQAWRLHRLAQHLGLDGAELATLEDGGGKALLAELDALSEDKLAPIWLVAYERHYRDEVLNAIAQNRGRGRWAKGRTHRPRSQVVFCIDEREENLHRHYAELDPEHETLGAAGFFGVAQSFTALDDHEPTPLCPAVASPAHRILEIPRLEALHKEYPEHKRRFKWMEVLHDAYWETKRNILGSFFTIQLAGSLMAVPLLGRVFAPRAFARLSSDVHHAIVPEVRTRLTHVRFDLDQVRRWGLHVNGLPIGFAIPEGTDRVEAQLRNWGLTYQFSRIVVICAHRSFSVNNPHENAHDCGACGGKAGGPNSRLFAALANDPQVRQTLRERGIDIPDDTWFIGAEHNTCSDEILCFDTEDVPASLQADWQLVQADLEEARRRAARERCRRFGSAPKDASLEASLRHVEGRSQDISQVRPEWGHCTNAFAVVGRRCVTQGLFFDRRGFIISYDPTQDPEGSILERILMAVGPVGAGINLEYYFSTVDPDNYGCGTKVPHNVTGMIGVMAGAHGDLQTGLPRQMTEVHEAMRLQLIVDAKMEVLGGIYGRQAAIRQLLDNQWVHLIAHDPDSGELNLFVPGKGFVKWDEPLTPLPMVTDSYEWFKGKYECFLPPARIAEPSVRWTELSRMH